MKWDKYTIETVTSAEDLVSAALVELGIDGIEIENKVPLSKEESAQMFIDFPADLGEDDGKSFVSFYLESGKDHGSLLEEVRDAMNELGSTFDAGSLNITSSSTDEDDWKDNWKDFFHAFKVGDILIKPTWEDIKDDEASVVIEIDPGSSFGTGKHETTQLCIRALCETGCEKKRVLDVGVGSGILSIAAVKLGASKITGTDIDENCIRASLENFKVNHIEEDAGELYCGNLIDDMDLRKKVGKGIYDIAVANILADVIIPMAGALYETLAFGGRLICSGIIDFKEDEVKKALEKAGFKDIKAQRMGEWVGICALKE